MQDRHIDYLRRRKAYTPTDALIAERAAMLDRIEADNDHAPADHWPASVARGMEWTVWRASDGAVDFDLNVADALAAARSWKTAAAEWEEMGGPPTRELAELLRLEQDSPWLARRVVAVVRGRGMRIPEDSFEAYALRLPAPDKTGRMLSIGVVDLMSDPAHYEARRIFVEMLA